MSDAAPAPRPAAKAVESPRPRPLQLAQLVWRRTVELSDPSEERDSHALVLELARTARHDVSTMAHAVALGRSRVREHPRDLIARRGIRLLERTIAFLGVKPQPHDVRAAPRHRRASDGPGAFHG